MIIDLPIIEIESRLKKLGASEQDIDKLKIYFVVCENLRLEGEINKNDYQKYIKAANTVNLINLQAIKDYHDTMTMLVMISLANKKITLPTYYHYVDVSELAYDVIAKLNDRSLYKKKVC